MRNISSASKFFFFFGGMSFPLQGSFVRIIIQRLASRRNWNVSGIVYQPQM